MAGTHKASSNGFFEIVPLSSLLGIADDEMDGVIHGQSQRDGEGHNIAGLKIAIHEAQTSDVENGGTESGSTQRDQGQTQVSKKNEHRDGNHHHDHRHALQ